MTERIRRSDPDPSPSWLDHPVSLRAHVTLFALLVAIGIWQSLTNHRHVDPGFVMVSDPVALWRVLYWGISGTFFVLTTLLRLMGRARVLPYGLAMFLSPWAFCLVMYFLAPHLG